jgi:hypothetical protein
MAFENFTTFTETDPNSHITVDSAAKVSYTLFGLTESGRLFVDKGLNHFSADFTHQFEVTWSSGAAASTVMWQYMLSSTIGTVVTLRASGTDDYIGFLCYNGDFFIEFLHNGTQYADSWAGPVVQGTLYFITIVRDDDGGANNTGRYTCYIRTGSHVGTLVDTLVVDAPVGGQDDFQYLYGVNGHGAASGGNSGNGFTQNLELNEGAYLISKIGAVAIETIAKVFGVAIATIRKIGGVTIQ